MVNWFIFVKSVSKFLGIVMYPFIWYNESIHDKKTLFFILKEKLMNQFMLFMNLIPKNLKQFIRF
jgi:hypothetical protein